MGRPGSFDFPSYMTKDGYGGFEVRNPITKKKRYYKAESEARQAALALASWVANERKEQAWNGGLDTFAPLVARWMVEQFPFQAWSKGTQANNKYIFNLIGRELGDRPLRSTSPMILGKFLADHCRTADLHKKYRRALVTLYEFAISQGIHTENQAAKTLARDGSKKLAVNRKVRKPLDVEMFKAIHACAEPWLRLAMELSLLTLQSRSEVCNMRHDHFQEGHLFIIRDKVSGLSDMGFIKIARTAELDALKGRALKLDNVLSPFLVHRKPIRRKRSQTPPDHWTYVNPMFLSHEFRKARTRAMIFEGLAAAQRPGFHEIRGLGSRLAKAAGVSKEAIQAIMTHSSPKTTAIYLSGGREALSASDYVSVSIPGSLAVLK